MNLTAENVGAAMGVLVVLGGIVGWYLNLVDRRQAAEITGVKDGAAGELKAAKESLQKDLDAAHDHLRAAEASIAKRLDAHASARADLETRLRTVEREYVTRADHAQFRAELVAALEKVGDRVAGSMDKLRTDLREDMAGLNKRVAAVESRG